MVIVSGKKNAYFTFTSESKMTKWIYLFKDRSLEITCLGTESKKCFIF